MQNTKLFYILNSLSSEEFKRFEQFIESPFHNRNKKATLLFHEIKEFFQSTGNEIFDYERFFNKLYPGKKFNPAFIRNLFSEIRKLAEKFLALSYLSDNEHELEKFIIKQLKEKKLDKLFERKLDDEINSIESIKTQEEKNQLSLYELKLLKRNYLDEKSHLGKTDEIFSGISEELNHFVTFFVITMLKEYFHILSYKRHLKFDQSLTLYNEVMNIASSDEKMIKGNIQVKILYDFIKLYQVPQDDDLYFQLKSKILNHKDEINSQDFKNYLIEIYNYSSRRRLQDEKKFKKDSIEVMKLIVKEDVLLTDGFISANTYLNLAAKAFYEGEDKWVEKFINEYKDKVNPEHRDNAFNFNLSVLNYTKGSKEKDIEKKKTLYMNSLSNLAKVKSEDFFYMIRIKKLHLRIFYEIEDWESLDYNIDNFRHYLKQLDSVPEKLVESNKNFLEALKKLRKLNFDFNEFEKKKFLKLVESSKNIDCRNWLKSQANETPKS